MDENVRNSINPTTSGAGPPASSCMIGVNDAGTCEHGSTPVTQRRSPAVRCRLHYDYGLERVARSPFTTRDFAVAVATMQNALTKRDRLNPNPAN
jgi:hypothetical protein